MLAVAVQICTLEPRVPDISVLDAISHQATEISSPKPQPNGAVCNMELKIKQPKGCCVVLGGEEVRNEPADLGGRDDAGTPGLDYKVGVREGWSHPLYNLSSLQQPQEVGAISPILKVRKARLREVKLPAQGHTAKS